MNAQVIRLHATPRPPNPLSREPAVALTPEVEHLLTQDCVVAIGVSGGKDSQACALAVAAHLDKVGHTGPRVLIHADLGRVEWAQSLSVCERLAAHMGWELMTVRRKAGDMMARWEGRWSNNVGRYEDLSCVKLILPWSTPSMRFCTSELKVDVITSALKKRFPDHAILNVAGIRREESTNRQKMPVSGPQAKLMRRGLAGVTWNAIIEWNIQEVFDIIARHNLALHEAYTLYGASRVSCAFCIMSAASDMLAAAGCTDNHAIYIEMVKLEVRSTFAFQGGKWLADVAPHLLPAQLRADLEIAKQAAHARQIAEARLPTHLMYTAGWPTHLPNRDEADLIAAIRRDVNAAVGLNAQYLTGGAVIERYQQLYEEIMAKTATKEKLCA